MHKNQILYVITNILRTKCTKEDKPENAANHPDSDNDSNSSNDHLKIYEEDLYLSDTDKSEKLDDIASGITKTEMDSKIEKEQNISYKLFTIGPMESSDHDRVKHNMKEYKMLVRTKTDGVEVRIYFILFLLIISIKL